jgi:hypothetical protein
LRISRHADCRRFTAIVTPRHAIFAIAIDARLHYAGYTPRLRHMMPDSRCTFSPFSLSYRRRRGFITMNILTP